MSAIIDGLLEKHRARIITMYDYQKSLEAEETDPLVPGLLWPGSITLLVAETSSGKSTLVYRWGYHFSRGEPWLDVGPTRPLKIGYVDLENPASAQVMLSEVMEANVDQPWVTLKGYTSPMEMPTALTALGERCDLIIVDNLQHAFPVNDEQDNARAIDQMQKLMEITDRTGVGILATYNSGKAGDRTPMQRASNPAYARGAISRADQSDVVLNLVNEETNTEKLPEECKYILYVAKSRLRNRGEFWRYTYAGDLDYALAEHRQPGSGRGSTNPSTILQLLREHPEGLSTSEIADKTEIHRKTAGRNLKKLYDQGSVAFTGENSNDPTGRWLLRHGVKRGVSVDS